MIGDAPSTLKVVHDTLPLQVTEVVATVPRVFAPVQYESCPVVGAELVPSPRYENAPLDELYASGKDALRDELEILLLKMLQSPLVSNPLAPEDADGMFNVSVPPKSAGEPETLMSLPVEPVASAIVLAER